MGSCREPFSLDLLGIIPVVILFAFIFEGLQALIYALIMEYLITPKANMNNSLLVGGALGLLCGTLVPEDIFRFSLIGLIAGVITAYILKRHYIRHNSV